MNQHDPCEKSSKHVRDNDWIKRILMGEENIIFDEENGEILAEFL